MAVTAVAVSVGRDITRMTVGLTKAVKSEWLQPTRTYTTCICIMIKYDGIQPKEEEYHVLSVYVSCIIRIYDFNNYVSAYLYDLYHV